MKSVKALLFVMVFSLSILAGCSSTPTEVDDTARDVTPPVRDIVVPNTDVETTVDVTAPEATEPTEATGTTMEENAVDDTGVTTTDGSDVVTGETAE